MSKTRSGARVGPDAKVKKNGLLFGNAKPVKKAVFIGA
jgi:hypothetical protein